MASRPNTGCVGVACMVVCTTDLIAWRTADRTPVHLQSLRSRESRIPIMRIMLCKTWWTCLSNDGVCLGVASCDHLACHPTLILEVVTDFCHEFFSPVHVDLCWPWMSREPCKFQSVGYFVGGLLADLNHFEPSCSRIDHSHTVKRRFMFAFANLVRSDEVDAQSVPRNSFWRVLGRCFSTLL